MSKERHLEIENGTMGNLFRRSTLAALGLDALDDVSEQSFEVIDRADAFVDRLLGGISGVLPKTQADRMGTRTTELVDHIFEGMVGLNGPTSATDLGEWQYWLDATLLMLFDEYEDEAEVESVGRAAATSKPTAASARRLPANITPKTVRERIAALNKAGIKPAMLQAMSSEQKRQIVAKSQKQSKTRDLSAPVMPELLAASMKETLAKVESRAKAIETFDKVYAANSRQLLASRLIDKANAIQAEMPFQTADAKTQSVVRQWTEAVSRFEQGAGTDMATVRTMFSALESLEQVGAISQAHAADIRRNCQTLAKRALSDEIVHDVTLMAAKLEETSSRLVASKRPQLNAGRAVGISGTNAIEQAEASVARTFAALGSKLQSFNDAVSQYVLTSGETAATMRWQRAADRFERMRGISDDVDRVLLRDVVESASALGEAGIVPQRIVRDVAKTVAMKRFAEESRLDTRSTIASRFEEIASGKLNVAFAADSKHFVASPEIAQKLVERVQSSVRAMSGEMAKFEASLAKVGSVDSAKLSSFVASMRALAETAPTTASDPMSIVRSSAVLESICDKLDEFAQSAANVVVSLGYDELTNEQGVFVAPETESVAADDHAVRRGADQSVAVAQIQRRLEETHERALQSARRIFAEQAQTKAKEFASIQTQLRDAIENVRSVESLQNVKSMMQKHLNAAEIQAVESVITSTSRSEASLESIKRQSKIIESAVRLSNQLRETLQRNASVSTPSIGAVDGVVQLDDVRINPAYVATLGNSLATYSRIREGYRSAQVVNTSESAGTLESRIERMLTTLKPSGSNASVRGKNESSLMRGGSVVLGYDDVVPSSMEWIRQAVRSYPSQDNVSDLTAILGNQKAIERHATSVANGGIESVEALGRAVAKRFAESANASRLETYVAYGIDNDGERVKLTLGVNDAKRKANANAYELRRDMGASYMPEAVRRLEQNSVGAVDASLSISKRDNVMGLSGAQDFVPVIAGANGELYVDEEQRTVVAPQTASRTSSEAAQQYAEMQRYASAVSEENARQMAVAQQMAAAQQAANAQHTAAAQQVADAQQMAAAHQMAAAQRVSKTKRSSHAGVDEIMSGIAARLGLSAVQANSMMSSDRMQLRVGNVNFEMSAQGFVDLVAKPVVQNAAFAAPSLTDADNILFSGYASMLEQQGERRTLKGLRHAYMKSLAQAGRQSAHGDFGFNTQTFSGIMGNVSAAEAASKAAKASARSTYDASQEERAYIAYQASRQASTQSDAEWKLAEATLAKTAPVRSASSATTDFSWVSNAFAMHVNPGRDHALSASRQESADSERQILAKIDTMLDYVENKSQREVGVFGSEDTVRVLLEALPASASLGNKGLPKWRHKDTKSSRIAEARELRAALASIGASPIQGMQPFANKQYVSPNLLNTAQSAAPLFSGGSDSGSTPAASANASHSSSDSLDAPSISTEDLQTLAEDVFQKIIDSFNEELQRRRTE